MKKIHSLLLVVFLSISAFAQSGSGLPERPYTASVFFYIKIGQSNAANRALSLREGNDYSYQGISTAYPAAITTQTRYTLTPPLKTYYKGSNVTGDLSLDNGQWQDYVGGVNSCTDQVGNVGLEIALSTQLFKATGIRSRIAHCGFGGTALIQNTATVTPGTWNYTNRYIAAEYYIRRAIRDMILAEPNTRFIFKGFIWAQGETDAENLATFDNYKINLLNLKRYFDNVVMECLQLTELPKWYILKIKYAESAAEAVINSVFDSMASDFPGVVRTINLSAYPKLNQLSTAEQQPSLNAGNNHLSNISQDAAGELISALMLAP